MKVEMKGNVINIKKVYDTFLSENHLQHVVSDHPERKKMKVRFLVYVEWKRFENSEKHQK